MVESGKDIISINIQKQIDEIISKVKPIVIKIENIENNGKPKNCIYWHYKTLIEINKNRIKILEKDLLTQKEIFKIERQKYLDEWLEKNRFSKHDYNVY